MVIAAPFNLGRSFEVGEGEHEVPPGGGVVSRVQTGSSLTQEPFECEAGR